jgi:hypothetical protein
VNSVPGPCPEVIIDGNDLLPAGVPFDMIMLGLNSGAAYFGFTASTGGGDANQDILSWAFTPQGQTQTLQPVAENLQDTTFGADDFRGIHGKLDLVCLSLFRVVRVWGQCGAIVSVL